MYLCVCNAIREADFRQLALRSSGDVEALYAALGRQPQCRSCLCEAEEIMHEEREWSCVSGLAG